MMDRTELFIAVYKHFLDAPIQPNEDMRANIVELEHAKIGRAAKQAPISGE